MCVVIFPADARLAKICHEPLICGAKQELHVPLAPARRIML